jgi:hypothetical protein
MRGAGPYIAAIGLGMTAGAVMEDMHLGTLKEEFMQLMQEISVDKVTKLTEDKKMRYFETTVLIPTCDILRW